MAAVLVHDEQISDEFTASLCSAITVPEQHILHTSEPAAPF
jgi:hypothetical protein